MIILLEPLASMKLSSLSLTFDIFIVNNTAILFILVHVSIFAVFSLVYRSNCLINETFNWLN